MKSDSLDARVSLCVIAKRVSKFDQPGNVLSPVVAS
jgi:hypothetical protein